MDSNLSEIDAVFLDLDGTIYLGGELIPGAIDFLNRCDAQGVRRFFLSNNSSRSVTQYLEKLSSMGIPATEDDVLLSTPHDSIVVNLLGACLLIWTLPLIFLIYYLTRHP